MSRTKGSHERHEKLGVAGGGKAGDFHLVVAAGHAKFFVVPSEPKST